MGELHLEIMHDRLEREYGVPTRMGRPQVVHRETVIGEGDGEGRIERANPEDETDLIFGAATVRVRALPRGSGVKVNAGGAAAAARPAAAAARRSCRSPIAAALAGVKEGVVTGPEGYPVEDLEATVHRRRAARKRQVRRRLAHRRADGAAARDPGGRAGDARADHGRRGGGARGVPRRRASAICRRGARRSRTSASAAQQRTVAAKLPLKSLFGYSTAVRSASQGRATFTMRFAKFDAWS